MSELVMALYGVARVLKSRDLGPAQLMPAIASFRDEVQVQVQGSSVEPMFAGLRDAARELGALSGSVETIEGAAREMLADMNAVLAGSLKLGARQRLAMEREAERIGAELDALRSLADVVYSGLLARPVYVTLDDLLRGRWHMPPTFVRQRVSVLLGEGASNGLVAEPRVARGLLEHAFRQLAADQRTELEARARERGARMYLEIGPRTDDATGDTVDLGLATSLPADADVLAAVAGHLDMTFESLPGGLHQISLPA
jgi:hypothetical protein